MNKPLFALLSIAIVIALIVIGCFPEIASSASADKKGSSTQSQQKSAGKINATPFVLVLFWSDGCPYCTEEKVFLAEIVNRFPSMVVKDYEVWNDRENLQLMDRVAKAYKLKLQGVPVTFIGKKGFSGFSPDMRELMIDEMERCSIEGCAHPLDYVAHNEDRAKETNVGQPESRHDVCTVGSSDKGCE